MSLSTGVRACLKRFNGIYRHVHEPNRWCSVITGSLCAPRPPKDTCVMTLPPSAEQHG